MISVLLKKQISSNLYSVTSGMVLSHELVYMLNDILQLEAG